MVLFKGGADSLDPVNTVWQSTCCWGLSQLQENIWTGKVHSGMFVCLAGEAGAAHRPHWSHIFIHESIHYLQAWHSAAATHKKHEFDHGIHVQRSSLIAVVNFSWLPKEQPFHFSFTLPEQIHCCSEVAYWALALMFDESARCIIYLFPEKMFI